MEDCNGSTQNVEVHTESGEKCIAIIQKNNSAASSSLSFSFVQPVKLDQTNYLVWKTQVLASIIRNGLEGLINGGNPCPAQFLSESMAESSRSSVIAVRQIKNPEYIQWKKTNKLLQSWLFSSMMDNMLIMIQTGKNESLSISDYFNKTKKISDTLAIGGNTLSSNEFIMHILAGLDDSYESLVTNVLTRLGKENITVEELFSMLLSQEIRLEMSSIMHSFLDKEGVIQVVLGLEVANSLEEIMEEALEEPPMQPSFVYPAANMYAGNASLNSEQAFIDSTQGTAAASHVNPNAFIAISQGAAAAPLANYNVVADSAWYIDSGATNHVTQDADIFLSCSRYTGQEHRIILLKGIARDGLYQIEGLTIVSASDKPYVLLSSKSMSTIPWIFYHKAIGVSNFFLFVEGKAASPAISKVFESIPLIHPAGAREYSLRQLLSVVPSNVDMESCIERDDIKEPFSEVGSSLLVASHASGWVSMFKKNYDHLLKDVYFGNYREATSNNPNYFLTYGNGQAFQRGSEALNDQFT
ncbi:hypothetical protein WN944_024166 [Citrus x changshan-huyou]|uniref:Uncharacterized protein n=1 Tax=Citrus x changshan-huyou TaxID=2935761 RepID=A0AAP0LMH3_9ROSI